MKFLLLAIISIACFAQANLDEVNSKIKEIEKQEKIINDRIAGGQDASLFEGKLKQLAADKKTLISKRNSLKPVQKKKAVVKKVVKSTPKPRRANSSSLAKVMREIENLKKENKEIKKMVSAGNGPNNLKVNGHFQIRSESAKNRQADMTQDQSNEIFSRLRANFLLKKNEKLNFKLAVQATKNYGANHNAGQTQHSELTVYESFVQYNPSKQTNLFIGRQMLSYGDQLIIGALPWANTARSFDAFKVRQNFKKGWVDVFWAKLEDSTLTREEKDDSDLYGIYSSFNFGKWFKAADLYLLQRKDKSTDPSVEVNTIGFRLKGGNDDFFYRTENGVQSITGEDNDEAYQYNIEFGAKLKSHKLSVEYATAGKDYVQLYPTAHKFLGFADVLGRKNINHTALHYKGGLSDWLKLAVSYHDFKRNDTDEPMYNLVTNGNFGTTGDSDDVGSEVDVVATFLPTKGMKLQLGAAYFSPGEYFDDNGVDEQVEFTYVMLIANF